VRILGGAEKTGGMTPRIARNMLEEILGMDLPEFPANFPADVPFSLTMAEAVKNTADVTEPGQSVTALKTLSVFKALMGDEGEDVDFENDEARDRALENVMALQKTVQTLWSERQRLSAVGEDA
jgi:hypothetical protein